MSTVYWKLLLTLRGRSRLLISSSKLVWENQILKKVEIIDGNDWTLLSLISFQSQTNKVWIRALSLQDSSFWKIVLATCGRGVAFLIDLRDWLLLFKVEVKIRKKSPVSLVTRLPVTLGLKLNIVVINIGWVRLSPQNGPKLALIGKKNAGF